MKKRLTMALATGALVAAMVPGVAHASQPVVDAVSVSCLVDGEIQSQGKEIRGPLGEVMRELAVEWFSVCDPGTLEISAFNLD